MDHKQLIRHAFDELSTGNSRPLLELLADDVTWHVMGQTKWSGTYRGKAAVLNDIFGPLRARLADRYRATALRIIADEPYVVVQARGQATTKKGAPYNNEYCFVYRMENDTIAEVTEYMDTELVTSALDEKTPRLDNGKICYVEMPALEIDRSAAFYERVFGWETRRRGDGAPAFHDGVEVSGTWVTKRQAAAPGLVFYIMVDDAAAVCDAIVANGGEIVQPIGADAPEITALFRDPGGNVIGLYQQPR